MDLELIRNSLKVANQHVVLIIIIGICGTTIAGGNWTAFSLITFILGFILGIVLYGRMLETILKKEKESIKNILRKNGLNYFVVTIVLIIPVIIIRSITQAYIDGWTSYFIVELARTAVAVITIYVVPIVFLKKTNILSIPAGVAYLLSHLQRSKELILITIAAFLVGSIRIFIVLNIELIIAIPVIILIGVGVTYLLYVVFAGATHILTNND